MALGVKIKNIKTKRSYSVSCLRNNKTYINITNYWRFLMNAPGKSLLKVVSILFIIFSAIATVLSVLALIGSAAVAAYVYEVGAILLIATIVMLIASVLELILGIVGLKKCSDPAKAGFFITTGIILCVLTLVSFIMSIASGSFSLTSLIGFVLPVLYIVGGNMNKKGTASIA